jgi:hypothetical protein
MLSSIKMTFVNSMGFNVLMLMGTHQMPTTTSVLSIPKQGRFYKNNYTGLGFRVFLISPGNLIRLC